MDARGAPSWVLYAHAEDQLPNLLRRLSSSNLRPDSIDHLPVQTKTSPVPADYGFLPDDHESLVPS